MATLSASRRNSTASSAPGSPRPSVSGVILSRMSSLNEEDAPLSPNVTPPVLDQSLNTSVISESDLTSTVTDIEQSTNTDIEAATNNKIAEDLPETQPVEPNNNELNNTNKTHCDRTESNDSNGDPDFDKTVRMRVCSERSDSGISDCSVIPTQHNTPLLSKKFLINEEVVSTDDSKNILNTSESNGQTATVETELNILTSKLNLEDINGNKDVPSGKYYFV